MSEWVIVVWHQLSNFSTIYHGENKLIIIKSPKQSLGDLLFLLRFLLLFSFSFLSTDHELVHGRSQELQDRISWNLVEL